MKVSDAKELFRNWTADYFTGYEVIFANQSRNPKPAIPLVTIAFGNVKRPNAPNYTNVDGLLHGHYLSRVSVVVDLFTNGRPVTENGVTVAYENTAMDEMLAYCDFLNGAVSVDWSHRNDIAVVTEGDTQNLTGVVNDNNYEYRARQEIGLYFTQDTNASVTDDVGYFEAVSFST